MLWAQYYLARLAQSRCEHELGQHYLRGNERWFAALPNAFDRELRAATCLAAGLGAWVLGARDDARHHWEAVGKEFPDLREARRAEALLQHRGRGWADYRGHYRSDPRVRGAAERLLAAVPGALRVLAERLGQSPSEFPDIAVGFTDGLTSDAPRSGETYCDPRFPAEPPVVYFSTQFLSLGGTQGAKVLVHEFAHAVLAVQGGFSYERSPPWLVEGLSQALAGQFESNADAWLSVELVQSPLGFMDHGAFVRRLASIDFLDDSTPSVIAGMALLPIVEGRGMTGIREVVARLRAGEAGLAAVHAVAGCSAQEYSIRAAQAARTWLGERRLAAYSALDDMLAPDLIRRTEQRSEPDTLAALERAASPQAPPLARGMALWQRGEYLSLKGRHAQAEADFRTLMELGIVHESFVEHAHLGLAECLLHLERRAKLEELLEQLRFDLVTGGSRAPRDEIARRAFATPRNY